MSSRPHPTYKAVTAHGGGEVVEKRSRFIADVFPVHTPEEAEERIAEVKKRHYDAKHHCYAFAVGPLREFTRASDDGEPSGTAGKPILAVLEGAGLTDTLIVVTRYFGGTLLGAGGLVRAYTQAAQAGLADAPTAQMAWCSRLVVTADYSLVTPLQRYFSSHGLTPDSADYGERVSFGLHIITDDIEKVSADLTELSEGRIELERGGEDYFEVPLISQKTPSAH